MDSENTIINMLNNNNDHIRVTQIASPIGRPLSQRRTLIGLGLNKMHKTQLLKNTESVLGMVNKVKHLVKFEIL